MNEFHPETGEVLDDGDESGLTARPTHALDGAPIAKRSPYVADVLRMLEDGQFNVDTSEAMRELVKALEAHAYANKGVAKGKLTITLDMALANGIFVVTPDFKTKLPVQKRMGTALFAGDSGSLGRHPPGQGVLIGDRAPRDPFVKQEVRDI